MAKSLGDRPTFLSPKARKRLAKKVLTAPLAESDVPILGMAAKHFRPDLEAWILLVPEDKTDEPVAILLAAMLVDNAECILPLELMPHCPPGVLLRPDGGLRASRGFFLPDWALQEIDRVSSVLRRNHADYIAAVVAAIQQRETGIFRPLPPGVVFPDTSDLVRIGPPPPSVPIDLTRSDRNRLKLNETGLVRLHYANNRYLQALSDEQLVRRAEDIIGNIHVIDLKGRISLDIDDPVLYFWLRRFSEVQMEIELRHGPFPTGWKKMMPNSLVFPASIEAAGPAAAFSLDPCRTSIGNYLVKYGPHQFLEPALREGSLRIAPASSYMDVSLNPAIRDDELTAEVLYDPAIPFNVMPPGMTPGTTSRILFRRRLKTDYFVSCFTDRLASRLMLDFESDACLVIHEPEVFVDRINRAMTNYFPKWRSDCNYVKYFDPIRVTPREIEPIWFKHFRYAYQQEIRLIWLPPEAVEKLDYVTVTLGSLEDIAEIVLPRRRSTG